MRNPWMGRSGQSNQNGRFQNHVNQYGRGNNHVNRYGNYVGKIGMRNGQQGHSKPFVHPTIMRNRQTDRTTQGHIDFLLNKHDKIYRHVEKIPCGIRALTVSKDPHVAEMIKKHVHEMKRHMTTNRPVRACDPVFDAAFQNSKNIIFNITSLKNGVIVEEISRSCRDKNLHKKLNPITTLSRNSDDCTEQIIVQHATAISKFVANGKAETLNCKRHEAPKCFKSRNSSSKH